MSLDTLGLFVGSLKIKLVTSFSVNVLIKKNDDL